MGSIEERERIRGRLDAIRGEQADTAQGVEQDAAGAPWLSEETHRRSKDWLPERLRGARFDPGRRSALTIAVVGVVAMSIAGFSVFRDRPQPQAVPPLPVVHVAQQDSAGSAPASGAAPAAEELVVSVVGLVHAGGLVRLPPGARIADAVAAAGGAQPGADLIALNMAQRVADGDQIVVTPPGVGPPPPAPGAAVQPGGAPAGKVGLNAATEAELDALPGVGPVTAAAIVAWRSANGKFTDVEQLGEVDGIGPGRLAKLRDLVGL